MSNMIETLGAADNSLSDEQQIRAVIHSFPDNWNILKTNIAQDENIKSLEDRSWAARGLDFKD